MTAIGYIFTFVSIFYSVVGMFSYLDGKNQITIQHIFMGIGIGLGIFGAALIGMSFDIGRMN